MDRAGDLAVAGAAAAGTLTLVAAGELAASGGPVVKMLPLLVYFGYAAGPGGRVRAWVGAVAAVTLAALGWLLV